MLLKITISDGQQPSVQSPDRIEAEVEFKVKLRKYVFAKTWKVAVAASISENK